MRSSKNLFPGVIYEENVSVRMRDGTILRANIYRPAAPGRYPAILERTPYGKNCGMPNPPVARFVLAGYACIFQDARGRYASGGDWIPFITPESYEAKDGYDTVEWIARQKWCNGRVGTMGASYNSLLQWKLASLNPPHLCAMCARTFPPEVTDIDFTGGIFRVARRIKWLFGTMASDLKRRNKLPPPHSNEQAKKIWDNGDGARLLNMLPVSRTAEYLPEPLGSYFLDWMKNPSSPVLKLNECHQNIRVPNLDITGWFDHCNETIHHLALMKKNAATACARKHSKIIIGPWNHCLAGKSEQGSFNFGLSSEIDIAGIMIKWFDRWLKDLPNGEDKDPPVRYFVMGSGEWRKSRQWPPEKTGRNSFYLHNQKNKMLLSTGKPGNSEKPVHFVYDPWDPVPSLLSQGLFTGANDRSVLDYRSDILRYRTAPLNKPVLIAGNPVAVLYVSSSAPDTDFHVHLADEDPSGRALEISSGALRVRHRNGIDKEELVTPGTPVRLEIKMGPAACLFKPGHVIRLEITSSSFPSFDRNHNTGGNDLFEEEMTKAEQTLFNQPGMESHISLPVLKA